MCELYEDCSKKAADSPAAPSATEHSTPFAAQAAQTAPNVKSEHRCLRVATRDFDTYYDEHIERRYNWGGRDARETIATDCEHLCRKASDESGRWCVGYEFTRDGNGTCELYDDCSKQADSATTKEAQAAPAKVERCLRVADHNFDALFADQLDGSGNPGRKSTKADCDHACNNADSEHSAWCIGFEFRETEKGMCELYEDCSKKAATADSPAAPSATEHSTPFAAQAAQTAPNVKSEHRCLRVATRDFDTYYDEHIERRYNWGGR